MKLLKLISMCLGVTGFYCCNNAGCQHIHNVPGVDGQKTEVPNFDVFANEFERVFAMKTKDSILIGDVYVRFVEKDIFTDLLVINGKDTLYSIKRNVFVGKNGTPETARSDVFGYTFSTITNDFLFMNIWRDNGECNECPPVALEWNNETNALQVIFP